MATSALCSENGRWPTVIMHTSPVGSAQDKCPLMKGYNYSVNAWWRPQIGVCLKGYNYSVNAWWRPQIGVCLKGYNYSVNAWWRPQIGVC